jgi:hypothetical protein
VPSLTLPVTLTSQEYLVAKLKENAKPVNGRNDIKVSDEQKRECSRE